MPGRIAFVPLRYGPQIVGGSEALTREIAMGLSDRGWEVDILTSQVVNHYSMANELPGGVSIEDGLRVHRFPAVAEWSRPGLKAQKQIEAGILPDRDDQWTWLSWRFRMPDLFHHLLRHGPGYESVVFSPYMFWNTTACVDAVRDNAVVMPCLHDEVYARLEVMRPVLSVPRGIWFLSEPEHELAHRLGPVADHHTVTGAGIHVPATYDPRGFLTRHHIERPFILYAGRRERDKGWGWLVGAFADAVASGLDGVDLLTVGAGDVEVPAGLTGRVRDLGFVSDSDRNDALAAALAYVQPSRMESFSRTIMEAWLAGTPVLAIDGSPVVDWHCRRSGGGLIFTHGESLATHIRSLAAEPERGARLAAAGRDYVLQEYSWPVVLDRMEADLEGSARPTGPSPAVPEEASVPLADPVVVVGSYPPIPLPAAAATLDEAERARSGGGAVTVVSPRLSAADLAVPAAGALSGRRLANVRRYTGADHLILVAERGFPIPDGSPPRQLAAALSLRQGLGRYRRVRLVLVGPPGWPAWLRRLVTSAADEVAEVRAAPAIAGLTPLGPPEVEWRERPRLVARRLAGRGARLVFGERAPSVRVRLGALRRRLSAPGRNHRASG